MNRDAGSQVTTVARSLFTALKTRRQQALAADDPLQARITALLKNADEVPGPLDRAPVHALRQMSRAKVLVELPRLEAAVKEVWRVDRTALRYPVSPGWQSTIDGARAKLEEPTWSIAEVRIYANTVNHATDEKVYQGGIDPLADFA